MSAPDLFTRRLRWADLDRHLPSVEQSRAKIRELDAIADALGMRRPSAPKPPWELYWEHLTAPVSAAELERVEDGYRMVQKALHAAKERARRGWS